MSDLNNLFSQRNRLSPPIKRLFNDDSGFSKKRSKSRSTEPHKSIRKFHQGNGSNVASLQVKDFAKRYIQKEDVKKEIDHYNNQISTVFVKKIFFLISAVILFNICFTQANHRIMLCNVLLILSFAQIQLGKDFLGKWYFLISKESVKLVAYCLNFYVMFTNMHLFREKPNIPLPEALVIVGNAALNYIILTFCRPLVMLERVKNTKQPYLGFVETLKTQLFHLLASIKTLYHLRRPILVMNLSYCFFVLLYIISQQSQEMLTELVTFQSLFAIGTTTLLLYIFIYFIAKLDEIISIQLLSPDKKTVSLNLLRLDCQNKNNQMISTEILKYIWKNSEIMWDVQFLSHNYAIKYDVLEDYLNLELQKIAEKSLNTLYNLRYSSQSRIKEPLLLSLFQKLCRTYKELLEIYNLAAFYQNKVYVFYIIEHINHFEQYSTTFPINTNLLAKKIFRMEELIIEILDKVQTRELKQSLSSFHQYFHSSLLPPFRQ